MDLNVNILSRSEKNKVKTTDNGFKCVHLIRINKTLKNYC